MGVEGLLGGVAWAGLGVLPGRGGGGGAGGGGGGGGVGGAPGGGLAGGLDLEGGLELGEAGQQAVDEGGGRVGGQVAGQQDGLADRHGVGHVGGPEQLVDTDAQDVPVHGGHPVQGPALGELRDQLVDPGRVVGHAADQVRSVGRDRRAGQRDALGEQVKDRHPAQFGLEQDVQGPLACLATSRHSRSPSRAKGARRRLD